MLQRSNKQILSRGVSYLSHAYSEVTKMRADPRINFLLSESRFPSIRIKIKHRTGALFSKARLRSHRAAWQIYDQLRDRRHVWQICESQLQ